MTKGLKTRKLVAALALAASTLAPAGIVVAQAQPALACSDWTSEDGNHWSDCADFIMEGDRCENNVPACIEPDPGPWEPAAGGTAQPQLQIRLR